MTNHCWSFVKVCLFSNDIHQRLSQCSYRAYIVNIASYCFVKSVILFINIHKCFFFNLLYYLILIFSFLSTLNVPIMTPQWPGMSLFTLLFFFQRCMSVTANIKQQTTHLNHRQFPTQHATFPLQSSLSLTIAAIDVCKIVDQAVVPANRFVAHNFCYYYSIFVINIFSSSYFLLSSLDNCQRNILLAILSLRRSCPLLRTLVH